MVRGGETNYVKYHLEIINSLHAGKFFNVFFVVDFFQIQQIFQE